VFYSKNTGLEVSLGEEAKDENVLGKIYLRAFPLEKGGKENHVVMKLSPVEGFKLSKLVDYVAEQKKTVKQALIHKFSSNDSETTTSLQIDYWERNGKNGFAIVVSRNVDKASISVPLNKIEFMFFSTLLERWSVDAAFEKRVEKTR
jgi:DNA primase